MSDTYTPEQIEDLVRQAARAGYEAVDTTGRTWDEVVQERSPFRYGREMRRARAIIAAVAPAAGATALRAAAEDPAVREFEKAVYGPSFIPAEEPMNDYRRAIYRAARKHFVGTPPRLSEYYSPKGAIR